MAEQTLKPDSKKVDFQYLFSRYATIGALILVFVLFPLLRIAFWKPTI